MRYHVSTLVAAYLIFAAQPVEAGPLSWAGRIQKSEPKPMDPRQATPDSGPNATAATTPHPQFSELSSSASFPSSLIPGHEAKSEAGPVDGPITAVTPIGETYSPLNPTPTSTPSSHVRTPPSSTKKVFRPTKSPSIIIPTPAHPSNGVQTTSPSDTPSPSTHGTSETFTPGSSASLSLPTRLSRSPSTGSGRTSPSDRATTSPSATSSSPMPTNPGTSPNTPGTTLTPSSAGSLPVTPSPETSPLTAPQTTTTTTSARSLSSSLNTPSMPSSVVGPRVGDGSSPGSSETTLPLFPTTTSTSTGHVTKIHSPPSSAPVGIPSETIIYATTPTSPSLATSPSSTTPPTTTTTTSPPALKQPTQEDLTQSPTGTSTIPASVYETNLAYARQKNQEWASLTPGGPCSNAGERVCINGNEFHCADRTFQMSQKCPEAMGCHATPWENADVIRIGCIKDEEAKRLLRGNVDGDGSGNGNGNGKGNGGGNGTVGDGGSSNAPENSPAPTSDAPSTPEPITTTTKTSTAIVTKTATHPKPTSPNPPAQTPSPSPDPTTELPAPEPTSTSKHPDAGTTFTDRINKPDAPPTSLALVIIGESYSVPPIPTPSSNGDSGGGKPHGGNDGQSIDGAHNTPAPTGDGPAPNYQTTRISDGTPTVSLYFTVTVTEKERETVTLIVPN